MRMMYLRKVSEEIDFIVESLDAAIIMLKHKKDDGVGSNVFIQSSGNLGDFIGLTTESIQASARNTGVSEIEILIAITKNMINNSEDVGIGLEELLDLINLRENSK